MPVASEGLKSEALRSALKEALGGRTARLEELLGRHGSGHVPRPNLRLAAAFGAEIEAQPPGAAGGALALLERLGANDAAPDTPEVFAPIAAAHGWVGHLRAGRDQDRAWAALGELAADERHPVRVGTLDALVSFAARGGRGASELVARALGWLDDEDRERRYGTAALAVQALGEDRVLGGVGDERLLLAYLSRVIDEAADAPRSAERSEERRRLLQALPRTLAAVVARVSAGAGGAAWLEAECARARRPDVRRTLSDAVIAVRRGAAGAPGATVADKLRRALQASAKPPRDPTRIRPGLGRGKATRPTR